MAARRVNPGAVKMHRSYTAGELAARLGVHKNTVRNWQREGLSPIDSSRPLLFHGTAVRDFLKRRNAGRKRPCPPGTFYCFRCRVPRRPAGEMADYLAINASAGNLRAICEACETFMHRRVRRDDVAAVLPGIAVQFRKAAPRLKGSPSPSLPCDSGKQAMRP